MSTESLESFPSRLCYNPNCAKPLVQREGELDRRFKERRHCDTHCARTNPLILAEQTAKWDRKREEKKKQCEICEKDFCRGKDETTKVFTNRPTCSKPCAFEKRRREGEEKRKKHSKTCKICSESFYRRQKETTKVYAKRETCSLKCAQDARRETLVDKKSVNGQIRAAEYEAGSRLPASTPLAREIPGPPKPEEIEVWRPASWGGPYKRKVS